MKKLAFIIGLISLFGGFAFSQTQLAYSGDSGYTLVERTDLRRYVNGKYSGLTSREVRSFISRSNPPAGMRSSKLDRWYDGNFFVMEETLRNSQATMAGVHDAIPSVFKISQNGQMTMIKDNGYPTFRSFPSYTTEKLKTGDSWTARAERTVDPLNKGVFTRMPIFVQYTFAGSEEYKGEKVFRIKAAWSTNYNGAGMDSDPRGDSSLRKAVGSHKADIIVREATGEAILISDTVDETFAYIDGTQVNLKGRITMFTEYPPVIDRNKLIFALNRIAQAAPAPKKPKTTVAVAEAPVAVAKIVPEKVVEAVPAEPAVSVPATVSVTTDTPETPELVVYEEPPAPITSNSRSPELASLLEKKPTETIGSPSTIAPKNNMVFEETPAGIRLSVRDIKFKADSDEILPTEKKRLDEIAEVLKLAPNSQFLIEGHSAAVGNPHGEQTISEQRARRIANELATRGINASKFICKGHGGNTPVASNSTPEGRAQNRRVEITILE